MTMWRDEFLTRERIAERERAIREATRVRNLLSGEDVPAVGRDGATAGVAARHAVARLLAAGARWALSLAHRLDAGVDIDRVNRRSRTAPR